MYVWARLIAHGVAAPRRPRLTAPFGESVLSLRAWPGDCDTNGHINNGRYAMIADIGRYDLMQRTGIWRGHRKVGLTELMGGSATTFRREIRMWQRFRLRSRLLTWKGTRIVWEQRFTRHAKDGSDEIAVIFMSASGFYHPRERRFEPIDSAFARMGISAEAPPIDPLVEDFLKVQEDIRGVMAVGRPA